MNPKNQINNDIAQQIASLVAIQLLGPVIQTTIKEAMDEYLEFVRINKAHKTYIGVRTFYNHFFKFFSPIKQADSFNNKMIYAFLMQVGKTAPLAVENYFRIGRTCFNWLIKQNYLRQNPFVGIELPKRQKQKPAYYSLEEAQSIWAKLEESGKTVIKNILIVGFYTGARYGELTSLKWRSIKFDSRLISIGETFTTKTKRTREVPMNQVVFDLLSALKSKAGDSKHIGDEYVFSGKYKKKLTVDWVSKSFKMIVRELGMDESIHLYSTRHSAASFLVAKGANIYAIKEILGHTSILTTEIYTHSNIDDLRKAVEH